MASTLDQGGGGGVVEEEDEFEAQLRQEEQARLAQEDGMTLSRGATYTDDDGTVMEWDHERRAYFPKIDADFIAQYQINYGTALNQPDGQVRELTEEEQRIQYEEYWKNYYSVYTQEQPKLPKFDEEGNEIEDDNEDEQKGAEKTSEKQREKSDGQDGTDNSETSESSQQWSSDPTSEEHYQYNLYYYGKEYADAYRDYYREHPDAEAMPDFVAQNAVQADPKTKKQEEKKSKKKEKAEKRKAEPAKQETWFENDPSSSTQLYVSNLPSDITEDEFKEMMGKCGLIMFDPVTHQPKLKLYRDKEGHLKGDGLCTYIKQESVLLALEILDGSDLRGKRIKVERAKFELKGEFDPSKKKKKLNNKQKQRLKERQQKLFDWRPDKNPFQRGKHERVVILKNMFNIKEFDENPALIAEFRADVRSECLKFGDVKKVTLYDRNPEGVVSVTFKEPEEADKCIAALNGRWFAKNRVVAETFDGKTKYDVQETEEEKAKRLKDWEAFLEGKKAEEGQAAARGKAANGEAEGGSNAVGADSSSKDLPLATSEAVALGAQQGRTPAEFVDGTKQGALPVASDVAGAPKVITSDDLVKELNLQQQSDADKAEKESEKVEAVADINSSSSLDNT